MWSDWQRRGKWVPLLLSLEKYAEFTDVIGQKLKGVERAAWSIYLKASNDNARVGALRIILEALEIQRAQTPRQRISSVTPITTPRTIGRDSSFL